MCDPKPQKQAGSYPSQVHEVQLEFSLSYYASETEAERENRAAIIVHRTRRLQCLRDSIMRTELQQEEGLPLS
jgi:hypothetical protein